jgi:hypothetical protein
MAATASGVLLVTGGFFEEVDFDPGDGHAERRSRGGLDVFVVSLGPDGRYRWALTFGGPEWDKGQAIALAPDGDVVVAGYFHQTVDFDPGSGLAERTSVGGRDLFVARYDAGGAFEWARTWGGPGDDWLDDLTLTPEGDLLLSGSFFDIVDFDPGAGVDDRRSQGGRDVFVLRLDGAGDREWARTFGGAGEDFGIALAAASDGSIYVGGRFDQTADFDPGPGREDRTAQGIADDAYVLRLSSGGDLVWARTFGGSRRDVVLSMADGPAGSVLVTGTFFGTADLDPGPDRQEHTSRGERDIYLLCLDSSGGLLWAQSWGGSGEDWVEEVAVDDDGSMALVGSVGPKVDFDPGRGVYEPLSNGLRDAFALRLGSGGAFLWARTFGGTDTDFALAVSLARNGSVLVGGGFGRTVDFDPGPERAERAASGLKDSFVLRLDESL